MKNLELAWRRINTGTNPLYKRFFRPIYLVYEIAIKDNLEDLYERLKGGSYTPHEPTRFYLPKPSGFQRPITLLSIEDQIVFQCIANVFAEKLQERREKIQYQTVFSNILQPKNSIFFVENWHIGYGEFQDKVKKYYNSGYKWVAHFDLAAFYDTICHELLLKIFLPRGKRDIKELIEKYLLTWSSSDSSAKHGHGIPQGPLASDFLAESFLLPVDELLVSEKINYLRYCDDIRIFGKSEEEVRASIIKLEIFFRERGLIPQGAKHDIAEAKSIKDALGTLPSIRNEQSRETFEWILIPANTAYMKFKSALSAYPFRIKDKSRARFVLYHGTPSYKLTKIILKLMRHHPEHIDAFIVYLDHCKRSKKIMRRCIKILRTSPYEYVQGEIWHLIAKNYKFIHFHQLPLIKRAIDIIKTRKSSLPLCWGVLHFLCEAEKSISTNYSRFIKYQDPLAQGLIIPMLPEKRYEDKTVISQLLKRTSFEPSLMLAEQFINRGLTHNDYGVAIRNLPSQTQNVYRKLRLIKGARLKIDPMGELLSRRYKIQKYDGWKVILKKEYMYALQILNQADAIYNLNRSKWLQDQNAFNHSLFAELYIINVKKKIIKIDNAIKKPEDAKTVKAYGILLGVNKNFSQKYPIIGKAFRECNLRRNSLPGSHPYNNSGQQNKWLMLKEQKDLTDQLKEAYREIIKFSRSL
jgi:hypothetical protein